jgi:hypothetical protein
LVVWCALCGVRFVLCAVCYALKVDGLRLMALSL